MPEIRQGTKIQLKTKVTDSATAKPSLDIGEPLFDTNTNHLHVGDAAETVISDKHTFLPAQGKNNEYHITYGTDSYQIESDNITLKGTEEIILDGAEVAVNSTSATISSTNTTIESVNVDVESTDIKIDSTNVSIDDREDKNVLSITSTEYKIGKDRPADQVRSKQYMISEDGKDDIDLNQFIINKFNLLDSSQSSEKGQFVTGLTQVDGLIESIGVAEPDTADVNLPITLKGKYTTNSVGGINSRSQLNYNTLEELLQAILGIQDGNDPQSFIITNSSTSSIDIALGTNTKDNVSIVWSYDPGTHTSSDGTVTFKQGSTELYKVTNKDRNGTALCTLSITDTDNSVKVNGTCSIAGFNLTTDKTINVNRQVFYGPMGGTLSQPYLHKNRFTSGYSCTFNLSKQKCILQYPAYWGGLSSITDGNGFDSSKLFSGPETTTKSGYYTYTLNEPSSETLKFTFKI